MQLQTRRETEETEQAKAGGVWLPHLPALDGLRAIAVLAVLLYHAEVSLLPGGFLGVEVFFVISGYLITALLIVEWCQKGRLDLKAFWLRRARRLLPALFGLLIFTLVFSVVFLPEEVAGLRGDVLAALGYVTNWFLIFDQKSYFETVGRPPLLQHLWSLSVEEQFYLLWPLLFVAGVRLWRYRVLLAVLAGIVASTALMIGLYRPDSDPSRIYYGTDTRAAGLLIGAALAFCWMPWLRPRRSGRYAAHTLTLAGFGAFGLLLWAFSQLDQFQPLLYRGGLTGVSLATAAMIAVAVHPRPNLFAKMLALPPVRWVGLRSYGLYLWHWPIFQLTRPELDLALDGLPLLALRLGLTGLLAELSYRLIEMPVRRGALGRLWTRVRTAQGSERQRLALLGGGLAVLLGGAGIVLGLAVVTAPLPAAPSFADNPANPLAARSTGQTNSTDNSLLASPAAVALNTPDLSPTPAVAPNEPVETAAPNEPAETVALAPTALPTPAPAPTATPPPTPIRVLAIGDSVMLRAAPQLKEALPDIEVDAEVGRHLSLGAAVIQSYKDKGRLGDSVIIHLGSNGGINDEQFDSLLKPLKSVRRVEIINLRVPRQWERYNNEVLARGVKRYPNAMLIDWRSSSNKHPEFFLNDGFHPSPDGAKLYARMIADGLKS